MTRFVVPLHVKKNHWALAVVTKDKIEYYDSLYDSPPDTLQFNLSMYCANATLHLRIPLFETRSRALGQLLPIEVMKVPKQEDTDSCGVYALYFAACVSRGESPSDDFNPVHYRRFIERTTKKKNQSN